MSEPYRPYPGSPYVWWDELSSPEPEPRLRLPPKAALLAGTAFSPHTLRYN